LRQYTSTNQVCAKHLDKSGGVSWPDPGKDLGTALFFAPKR
jgi:hypothetical protein